MSDYISKSELLETLAKYKFGAISNDAEREYTKEMMLLIVGEQPTVDEKEIICKTVERIVERLEESADQCIKIGDVYGFSATNEAIFVVKEEGGTSDC